MGLIHNGLDSKVKGQSYEAKREYEVLEVKKCCSLSWLSLSNYMIPTCERNYKNECQQHVKGKFIDLMFKRPTQLDKGGNLMTEHNDIGN